MHQARPGRPPAVSVLVTTFNHRRFVDECLDSVRGQTVQDFELIITDDASEDGTADCIQAWLDRTGFPAQYLRNPRNRGLCANRNRSIAMARGRFICSLSGDDAYEPERIERHVAYFAGRPADVAAVYSDARMIDAEGLTLHPSFLKYHLGDEPVPEPSAFFERLLLRGNFIPAPATTVRREAFEQVGPYDESMFYEDFQMWPRMSQRFRFECLEGCLVRYRMVPDSMSHSPRMRRAMLETTARVLASWLGKCGPLNPRLVDRLWAHGCVQLDHGFREDARRTFAIAASADPRLRRRLAARLVSLPAVPYVASCVRRGGQLAYRARSVAMRRLAGIPTR